MNLRIGFFLLLIGLLSATKVNAQQEQRWEDCYAELIGMEGESEEDIPDYDLLCDIANHPININQATKEDLEQLPFLSDQQIEDIMEYLFRYHSMQSLGELYMIPSLGYTYARLLSYFIYLGKPNEAHHLSWQKIMRYGRHKLVTAMNIPTYSRRGFKENQYLGGPIKHWLRYTFNYVHQLEIGFTGANDAGEPFFKGRNSLGYDYNSLYLMLRNQGWLKSLAIGKYRVRLGMGLVMNCDYGFGKQMLIASLDRSSATIRPHTSRAEANYLQGVAATFKLNSHLEATTFLSYRQIDGTLCHDSLGAISAISSSGAHRTATEMAHKHNTDQFVAGGHLHYFHNGFHVGITALYTALNRELHPDTTLLYKRWAAMGKRFFNAGIDYGYTGSRLCVSGELATDAHLALATIHKLTYRVANPLQLVAIQRFYAYKYNGLFARSFADAGAVKDESGLYLGVNWNINRAFSLLAYGDFAYFAWPKYGQSIAGTHALDGFLLLHYQQKQLQCAAQYRIRHRQRDDETKSMLIARNEHRGRLKVDYSPGSWHLRTQADFTYAMQQTRSFGYMLAQSIQRDYKRIIISGTLGYFHTQDYNSRVCTYERGMLYDFSFPNFFGHGIRYSFMARTMLNSHLTLLFKAATTDYFNRNTIGSGWQKIAHSAQTDIQLQAIVKL